jgi:MFS family permease
LDSAALNYSAVMGIKDNLKGNEFGNLGTIYNAAYIVGEPFCGYLIQKYPLSKVFGSFIILWGVVVACHAACHTYAALMVVRTLLGFLQSSVAVALICIVGGYYTRAEQIERIGYYCNSAGFGYIFGGLLSFGFQHVRYATLKSWQILFLMLGLVTFVFGFLVFFFLPDNLTKAWFLTDDEKILVLEHIRSNQTGVENKKVKKSQLKELFFEDKQTWPMLILCVCSQIVTGAVGIFSSTITATFGFDNYVSAILQIPIGVIVIICITASTQLISKFGHITLFHVSMYVPSVVGAIMLTTLPLDNKIGNLFGLYLLYSGSCAITLLYVWNGVNTAGYTKRVFRNTTTMMALGISNIIGPQIFRDRDYPEYMPAKITILVTQIVSIPLCLFVGYLGRHENIKRDKLKSSEEEEEQTSPETYEFLDYTDIENKSFRYLY